MGVFDSVRGIFRGGERVETKQSSMVGYFGIQSGAHKNYSYEDLAREGYLKNAIVYRCISEISKGANA